MKKEKNNLFEYVGVQSKSPETIKEKPAHNKVLLAMVSTELALTPNEVRISKQKINDAVHLAFETQKRGFNKVKHIEMPVKGGLLDFLGLANDSQLRIGERVYSCVGTDNTAAFFKSSPRLRSGYGKESFNEMLKASKRSTGVMYMTGNSKSSLNACFYSLVSKVKEQHDNWVAIRTAKGQFLMENGLGSYSTASVIEEIKSSRPSLVIIEEPNELSHHDIFEIAKCGTLVLVKRLGGNTLHVFSELFNEVSYVLLSNYLIGVGTTNLIPIVKDEQALASVKFESTAHQRMLMSLELSIQPDEEVLVYGKNDFENSLISGHLDLFDFIESPQNLRVYIAEKGSSIDLYPIFKNKIPSLNLCLDLAASLMRSKETAIDLIGRFVTPN